MSAATVSQQPLTDGELHQLQTDVATRVNFAQILQEDVPLLLQIQRAIAELKVRRRVEGRS